MNLRLVFTAYNRPHYFAEVLDAWTRVRGFADWKPLVMLEPSDVWEQMSALAQGAGATVHLNPRRYGVLSNPWHALNTAFGDGADFAVLAEDDLLPGGQDVGEVVGPVVGGELEPQVHAPARSFSTISMSAWRAPRAM